MIRTKKDLFFFFLILIITAAAYWITIDLLQSDLGRHLKIGEIFQKTGKIISTNTFSYTQPDSQYVNHNWLSAVIYWLLFSIAGFKGLSILNIVLAMLSLSMIIILARRQSDWWALLFSVLLYLPFISLRSEVRPEMFSLFLLPLLYLILEDYKRTERNPSLSSVSVTLLLLVWLNLHSFWILGFILCLINALFLYFISRQKQKSGCLLFSLTLFLLVSLTVNPQGIRLLFYPFSAALNSYPGIIDELLPLWKAFSPDDLLIYLLMIFLGLASTAISYYKNKQSGMIFILFYSMLLVMTVKVNRLLPLFYLFSILPLSMFLSDYLKSKSIKNIIVLVSCLLIIQSGLKLFLNEDQGLGLAQDTLKDLEYVSGYQAKGPIFNEFETGNILIYYWFPQTRVFIDGRPEAYSQKFLKQYQHYLIDWQTLADSYGFQTIVLQRANADPQTPELNKLQNAFIDQIINSALWQKQYSGDKIILLSKKQGKN